MDFYVPRRSWRVLELNMKRLLGLLLVMGMGMVGFGNLSTLDDNYADGTRA